MLPEPVPLPTNIFTAYRIIVVKPKSKIFRIRKLRMFPLTENIRNLGAYFLSIGSTHQNIVFTVILFQEIK
jgi:hypothetical protein